MRRVATLVFVALTAGTSGGVVGASGELVTGRVISVGASGRVAWLRPTGAEHHAQLDDRVVLHHAGRLVGVGQVMGLSGSDVAVRLTWLAGAVAERDAGLVIGGNFCGQHRKSLPEGCTIGGRVERLAPGGLDAWMAVGMVDGLRSGDLLLIWRDSMPIAAARVTVPAAHRVAVELTPLIANVQVTPGDWGFLWPSPWEARVGVIESVVLDVQTEEPEPMVTVAGGITVGIRKGDSFAFYRHERYVGLGEAVRVDDRLCQVRVSSPFSRERPHVGDTAIRRGKHFFETGVPGGRVFRIEGHYCLINVGEREAVRRGQRLAAVRDGKTIATLRIRTVKVDYCGADVEELSADGGKIAREKIELWDEILPEPLLGNDVERIGTVAHVAEGGWALDGLGIEGAKSKILEEMVVFSSAGPDKTQGPGKPGTPAGAGVVIAKGRNGFVIYSPRTWRHAIPREGDAILLSR